LESIIDVFFSYLNTKRSNLETNFFDLKSVKTVLISRMKTNVVSARIPKNYNIKAFYHLLLFLLFIVYGCKTVRTDQGGRNEGELIFQSGFEATSTVISKGADADIVGADQSLPHLNDWVKDLDENQLIGNFSLQFQGGDSTMRFAKIISEPANPKNKVLQFWLNEPNVEQSKGRIQANLYNNKGLKEFYQSVRMFLPEDFNTVKTYPKEIHWLTIAEFWNNITWSQTVPYGFRITLGIGKAATLNSDLHFIVDAEDCQLFQDGKQKYTTVWAETSNAVEVPVGKWFTMDYYYKEGNKTTGRFYLSITPEGERKQVVFDIRNFTHNTTDPNPDGVTDFNPMKLYTSKELINYMRSQKKTLQIYWDDFKLWKNKRPD